MCTFRSVRRRLLGILLTWVTVTVQEVGFLEEAFRGDAVAVTASAAVTFCRRLLRRRRRKLQFLPSARSDGREEHRVVARVDFVAVPVQREALGASRESRGLGVRAAVHVGGVERGSVSRRRGPFL